MEIGPLWDRPWPAAVSAATLAAVLLWAAATKWRHPVETTSGLVGLGIEGRLATVVGALLAPLEAGVALALMFVSAIGGLLAFALLAGFTVFLHDVIRRGVAAPCRCFGAASDRPVGWGHLVRNGLLLVLALIAALAP